MDLTLVFIILGAFFLAWTLGANDASNCFGLAVSEKIISYFLAVSLCSFFLILGAYFQGSAGIDTYRALSKSVSVVNKYNMALSIAFSSAICIFVTNFLKSSVSVSQVVAGAIVGASLVNKSFHAQPFIKIVSCWALVPVLSIIISFIVYFLLFNIFKRLKVGILENDIIIKYLLILIGCYASYALGANNVANIVGVLPEDIFNNYYMSNSELAFLAGIAISLGVITYSKKIMLVVGKGILKIDGFGALVSVLSSAISMHAFALIGVPVSSSHSIIGALLGVGIVRGGTEIRYKKLSSILKAWMIAPIASMMLSVFLYVFLNNFK